VGEIMNERIKLFEKQCWDYQSNCLDAEKFAELIILECAEMFEGVYTDEHPSERIDTRIKQHFGVEE
jgi:hypothetical protein